jgi:mono/diheme cytochrome c family protein
MRLVLAYLVSITLGAAILWMAAGQAEAVAPSPETGADIASRWCADCHVVSLSGAGNERAPSFPALSSSRTSEQISDALKIHKQPVRGFTLSSREIQDVSAYISSLKEEVAAQ